MLSGVVAANAIMAYGLRKRLTRRQGNQDLTAPSGDEDTASESSHSPTEITSTPSSRDNESLAPDDLSNTSPPPQSSVRRVSPSSSILNGYKLRAPVAVAASASPANVTVNHKTGRSTAFTEVFGQSLSPHASAPATEPSTPTRDVSDPITVRGVDFQMLTSSKDDNAIQKSNSVEVLPAVQAMNSLKRIDAPRKRLTRSQSRRAERADSGAAGVERKESDAKDEVTTRKDSKSGSVASLETRKNSNSEIPRTPSPSSATDTNKHEQFSPDMIGATPANTPDCPPMQPLINYCKNSDPNLERSQSPDELAISPDPLPVSPRTNKPTIPAGIKTRTSDLGTWSGSVLVNPPHFNPTMMPLFQFCSHYSSTSRPEIPWGWMKKWYDTDV